MYLDNKKATQRVAFNFFVIMFPCKKATAWELEHSSSHLKWILEG